MGEIAEKYSNELIITNDNPRWEDPLEIKKDIMKGLKKLSQTHFILDRREAIKRFLLIRIPKKDSVLLIAGKGHEDFKRLKEKNTLSVTRKLFRN